MYSFALGQTTDTVRKLLSLVIVVLVTVQIGWDVINSNERNRQQIKAISVSLTVMHYLSFCTGLRVSLLKTHTHTHTPGNTCGLCHIISGLSYGNTHGSSIKLTTVFTQFLHLSISSFFYLSSPTHTQKSHKHTCTLNVVMCTMCLRQWYVL